MKKLLLFLTFFQFFWFFFDLQRCDPNVAGLTGGKICSGSYHSATLVSQTIDRPVSIDFGHKCPKLKLPLIRGKHNIGQKQAFTHDYYNWNSHLVKKFPLKTARAIRKALYYNEESLDLCFRQKQNTYAACFKNDTGGKDFDCSVHSFVH